MPRPRVKDEDRKRVARACDTCKVCQSLLLPVTTPLCLTSIIDQLLSAGKRSVTVTTLAYYASAVVVSQNALSLMATRRGAKGAPPLVVASPTVLPILISGHLRIRTALNLQNGQPLRTATGSFIQLIGTPLQLTRGHSKRRWSSIPPPPVVLPMLRSPSNRF